MADKLVLKKNIFFEALFKKKKINPTTITLPTYYMNIQKNVVSQRLPTSSSCPQQ